MRKAPANIVAITLQFASRKSSAPSATPRLRHLGIGDRQHKQDQHADPIVPRHHRKFVDEKVGGEDESDQGPRKRRAPDNQPGGRGRDCEREERKRCRAPYNSVGRAQEEIPERRMSLAMQAPKHADPTVALDCDRQRPNFVPPHDVTPGERAGGGEPDPEEQNPDPIDRFDFCARRAIQGIGIAIRQALESLVRGGCGVPYVSRRQAILHC